MDKKSPSYDAMMQDAQYRKGLSIAFFNANNNATDIAKLEIGYLPMNEQSISTLLQERIIFWRDWLLSEHATYYAQVVMGVGKPYSIVDTIKKLETAKTVDELKDIWLLLSADERDDSEILANKDRIKSELIAIAKTKPVVSKVKKVAKKKATKKK